ncbi:alpha,alpha-trehalase [Zygosaccharomyces mellis]|uniref:Alpha,alpha-trehalase n=1 Tax=Zygosaccharomyces mellis TaxID=42258 RepID=A0A4C2EBA7_9SACH|nr:alpha,alpha-trehalase [Zygosaccharomyces mellis]
MSRTEDLAEPSGPSNQLDYDDTITKLLSVENFNDNGTELPESDLSQTKAFTLDNILNDPDSTLNFNNEDLGDNDKRPLNYDDEKQEEAPKKRAAYEDTVLSPISLSPLSTDENSRQSTTESKRSRLNSEFTMDQIKETKKRIINTHKLILNFNLLKDSYNKTCEEFKKSIYNLRESEIQRAHLYQENEKLRKLVGKLNGTPTHQ